jgi:hypothetical protein
LRPVAAPAARAEPGRARAPRELGVGDLPAERDLRDLTPHALLEIRPRRRERQVERIALAGEVILDLARAFGERLRLGVLLPVGVGLRRVRLAFEIQAGEAAVLCGGEQRAEGGVDAGVANHGFSFVFSRLFQRCSTA